MIEFPVVKEEGRMVLDSAGLSTRIIENQDRRTVSGHVVAATY